jgi:hypothetical protein
LETKEAAITTAANTIIGNNTNKRQNEWFDEECKEVITEKNEARQKALQRDTGKNWEKYTQMRKKRQIKSAEIIRKNG